MAVILAAIVITVFAAIFIPPLVYPSHEQFLVSTSAFSPYGFTLLLNENATQLGPGEEVSITATMNNTSYEVLSVPSANEWPIQGLYTRPCFDGWPIGIGIMQGYYTTDNYTSGSLLKPKTEAASCASGSSQPPTMFLIEADSPETIANTTDSVQSWNLSFSLTTGSYSGTGGPTAFAGVYTVVAGDEWGDVAITHFSASS